MALFIILLVILNIFYSTFYDYAKHNLNWEHRRFNNNLFSMPKNPDHFILETT